MKVSKALKDVWKWKEEVHQDIKDMNSSQRIAYFRQAGKRLAEKTGRPVNLRRANRRGKTR